MVYQMDLKLPKNPMFPIRGGDVLRSCNNDPTYREQYPTDGQLSPFHVALFMND